MIYKTLRPILFFFVSIYVLLSIFFTFYVYRIYIFISDLSNNNILWCVHANSPTPTTVQLQDLYHSLNSHNVMIVMTPRFYFIIMHYTSFVLLFSASITTSSISCDGSSFLIGSHQPDSTRLAWLEL